ncbi:MAG: hypothetical protein JWL81_1531 [Verrucomicrobiales bacterium]|nr:hypothetical protein [Verrucomicrobiales bacterium]
MKRILLTTFALAAGGSGGALMAHWFKPASAPLVLDDSALRIPRPSSGAAPGSPAAAAMALLEQMEIPKPGTGLGDQVAWLDRLAKADTAEMKNMLEEARKNPDPYFRRIFREMVFTKWIREDAAGAREFAQDYDDGRIRSLFVQYWAKADPDGAFDFYRQSGSWTQLGWACQTLAEEDPAKYLELVTDPAKGVTNSGGETTLEAVMREGTRGSQAAAEAAMKLPDQDHGGQMLQGSCFLWAQKNPEEAMKWAQSLEPGDTKNAALFGVLREMATRDPKAALTQIEGMGKITLPNSIAKDLATALVAKNPGEAETILHTYNKKSKFPMLVEAVLPSIEKPAVSTVMPLLEKFWDDGYEPNKPNLPLGAFSCWIPENAAAEWSDLAAFKSSDARTKVAAVLAPQLAKENPAAALAAASASTDPALKEMLAAELSKNAAKQRDEAAFLKASALLEGKALNQAVFDMTRELAESAPSLKEAVAFAERQQGVVKDRAMDMVAWVWAERDPTAALSWANAADSALSSGIKTELVQRWAKDDSFAASAWLNAQPPGVARDQFTYGLVRSIAESEPDSAFAWSRTLTDPAKQEQWSAWALQKWAQQDAPAAWQAVEAETMDEGLRDRLRQALSGGPPPATGQGNGRR